MADRILLTPVAFDHWWPAIEEVARGAVPVIARDEPRAGAPCGGRSTDDARSAEVAWVTFDIWDVPGAAERYFSRLVGTKGLQWCHTSAAGVDDDAYRSIVARGIRLTTSHVTSGPIGDFVLRAALDSLQGADDWRRAQLEQVWQPHEFREMSETTWLVVGLGAIGRSVARRASAFGAHVIGCRRSPVGDEPCDRVVLPAELAATAPEADVVVLAVPATAATRHLVSEHLLSRMRAGSVLINVARGSLIDDGALLRALDSGRPATAILDAFAEEPLSPSSPFWTHPRVVVTPHNSAKGKGSRARAVQAFLANLACWQVGAPLKGEIDVTTMLGSAPDS